VAEVMVGVGAAPVLLLLLECSVDDVAVAPPYPYPYPYSSRKLSMVERYASNACRRSSMSVGENCPNNVGEGR